MPYELKVDGMKEISEALDKLADGATKAASAALYEGAGIMADEIRKGADSIRTEPFQYTMNGKRLPSPEEKEIVMKASAGIAKFNKNGTEIDTSVGFRNAGYAELAGKQVPIPLIVNSINSGTSFMPKQPFVRQAAAKAAPKAMKAMIEKIETALDVHLKEINKI